VHRDRKGTVDKHGEKISGEKVGEVAREKTRGRPSRRVRLATPEKSLGSKTKGRDRGNNDELVTP